MAASTTLFADVKGIADAEVKDVPLCTVAGMIQTNSGPVIGIFHQYAHYGKGQTIHSPIQLEHFGLCVDDKCASLGCGSQTIVTPEGYVIPLRIVQGLVYMDMHPPSDEELSSLTQVTMTSDDPWDPSCLDNDGPQDEIPPARLTVDKCEAKHMDVEDFGPLTTDENLHACLKVYNEHITDHQEGHPCTSK